MEYKDYHSETLWDSGPGGNNESDGAALGGRPNDTPRMGSPGQLKRVSSREVRPQKAGVLARVRPVCRPSQPASSKAPGPAEAARTFSSWAAV